MKKLICLTLALLLAACAVPACAATFVDAHGNEITLDDTLQALTDITLLGADNAARMG